VNTGAILVAVFSAAAVSLPTGSVAFAGQLPPDVNGKRSYTAAELETAVSRGDLNSVRVLIHAGADVNARDNSGRTALLWAAQYGEVEIVRALTRAGSDLKAKDRQGWTPLTRALSEGHFDVVQALIAAGAEINRDQLRKDLNAKDMHGWTPLQRAQGNIGSFRSLIQLGSDVNATDNSGRTLLFSGRLDVIRAMIEAGADVNIKDKQGWTPLTLAAQRGDTAVVQTLIKAGADVNEEDPHGWSALMLATYFGHADTVRVLLASANVKYRSKDGISALMLARWTCHRDVLDELTRASAVISSGEWRRAPRFEDFPVSRIYRGAPAPVDLHSNPEAPSYRTRLTQGARKGPNFAGHYTVVGWGCGSNCESAMLVDALTGRVYDGFGDERGAEFRVNSNLVIADPGGGPGASGYPDNPTDSLPVRYYVWNENRLKLIYEQACSVVEKHQKCGCD
jgi:ankyrin repeat protein